MRSLTTALQNDNTEVNSDIDAIIGTLDLTAIENMLLVNTPGAPEASRSHTLITTLCIEQPAPTDEKYFQSDILCHTPAGAIVYKALLRHYGQQYYQQVKQMASIFARVSPVRN
jgi:hypothetical protein